MRETPKIGDERGGAERQVLSGDLWRATGGYEWVSDAGPQLLEEGSAEGGPWLRPVGRESSRYAPMRQRGLHRRFNDLARSGNLEAVQKFARNFGSLGFEQRLESPGPTEPQRANARAIAALSADSVPIEVEIARAVGRPYVVDYFRGESLDRWVRELLEMKDLFDVWEAILLLNRGSGKVDKRVQDAKDLLTRRLRWVAGSIEYHIAQVVPADLRLAVTREYLDGGVFQEVGGRFYYSRDVLVLIQPGSTNPVTGLYQFDPTHAILPGDIATAARRHVFKTVNERLGTDFRLQIDEKTGRPQFVVSSLLAAIYAHFAYEELGGMLPAERQCESCNLPMQTFRRDQRFCDKNCRERAGYHRRLNQKEKPS